MHQMKLVLGSFSSSLFSLFFFYIMFHMLPSINRLTIFQILIWELSSQSLQLLKKLEGLHHLFKLPASRLRSLRVFPKLQAFHFLKRETRSWRTPQGLFSWIPMLGSLPSYLTLICWSLTASLWAIFITLKHLIPTFFTFLCPLKVFHS